jgi:hypothetical protein
MADAVVPPWFPNMGRGATLENARNRSSDISRGSLVQLGGLEPPTS